MNRRDLLIAGSAAAALAPLAAAAQPKQAPAAREADSRKTFVLIHGSWHGGWCWAPVRERLEAAGHRVLTPTLTGLADRSHLMSAQINLNTHITDIVNLFRWEDLQDAVLVAHSYGGFPVSGALEHVHAQCRAAVFVDAFVPEHGMAVNDLTSPRIREILQASLARSEVARPAPEASVFAIEDPALSEWVGRKMTPQPNGVALDPLNLSGNGRDGMARKIYVRGTKYPQANFDAYVAAGRADPTWEVHELECGHHVMLDRPDELTEILLGA